MSMIESSSSAAFPFGGSADARAAQLSLAGRVRRHGDALARSQRSPLYVQLMRAAADDIKAEGIVAALFDGVSVAAGSVPALRLLAALHYLVLAGRAPELAAYYPSAGGRRAPEGVWAAALATLKEHFAWVQERLQRTPQTNDPGRSAVLFAGLLWLTERYRRPLRLLEIGSSAGVNLLVDRFCYVVEGRPLGDPSSPVRFIEPWLPLPDIDLPAAARALNIVERAGCDLAPIDPTDPEGRLTLLSYIWPDERHRLDRLAAALQLAAQARVPVTAAAARDWLPCALAQAHPAGVPTQALTVIWHSLVRQYVPAEEWEALQQAFAAAARHSEKHSEGSQPPTVVQPTVVWMSMEASHDSRAHIELALRIDPAGPAQHLAFCGDHGPPVRWE
jgi:hypothetical protein